MKYCELKWHDEESNIVECVNCHRIRKSTVSDLSKIRLICGNTAYKTPIEQGTSILVEPNDVPPLFTRLTNFSKSAIKHVAAGNPTCTVEEIEERHAICKSCEWYRKKTNKPNEGICGHIACGCNLSAENIFLNKLAWADQECPVHKWGKINRENNEK